MDEPDETEPSLPPSDDSQSPDLAKFSLSGFARLTRSPCEFLKVFNSLVGGSSQIYEIRFAIWIVCKYAFQFFK